MKVGDLFAEIGFKIDSAELDALESRMRKNRVASVNYARNLGVVNNRITSMSERLKTANKHLDATASKKGNKSLAGTYNKLANSIERAAKFLETFATKADAVTTGVDKIAGKVDTATPKWRAYGDAVKYAVEQLNKLRGNRPIPNPNAAGGGGRPLGDGGGGMGAGGDGGGMSAFVAPTRGFLKSMTPTGVMLGGAIGAGYITKEIVQGGREVQKMENVLLAASANAETFRYNLEYVRATANRMGISVTEFGESYAKALMATSKTPLTLKDTEKMFEGFSKLMVTFQLSAADQKGVFRALTQMFSKGKIQAEEMLQMAERGIPIYHILGQAAENLGVSRKELEKMQKEGKVDPSKFLPEISRLMGKLADNNGAYAKAINGSVAAQQRFENKVKDLAATMYKAGIDRLLGKMFNGLTEIGIILEPVASGLIGVVLGVLDLVKGIGSLIAQYPVTSSMLFALVTGLVAVKFAAAAAGKGFMYMLASATLSIKGIMLALKTSGLFVALFGLYMLFQKYDDYMKGEDNWLSFLGKELAIVGLKFKLFAAEVDMFMAKVGNGVNPFRNWTLESDKYTNPENGEYVKPEKPAGMMSQRQALMSNYSASSIKPVPITVVGSASVEISSPDGSKKTVDVNLRQQKQVDYGGLAAR